MIDGRRLSSLWVISPTALVLLGFTRSIHNGFQVPILSLRPTELHEVCQTQQTLQAVARDALAGKNLCGNDPFWSRAQVARVLWSGHIGQGCEGLVRGVLRIEGDFFSVVASKHCFPHIQVLQGLVHLLPSNLICYTQMQPSRSSKRVTTQPSILSLPPRKVSSCQN